MKRARGLSAGRLLGGVAAVSLMTSALAIRRRVRAAEAAHPPVGQFIEVDGVRLHYVVRGQGQPLLLLHGNLTMIQDLELAGLIDRAAERYQVIAFDRPGFGYSERPRTTVWTPRAQAALLSKALRQLGVQRPVVAGHSFGALVALCMALDFPREIRSLVLLSGYYFPTPRADTFYLSAPAVPVIGDLLRHTVSPWLFRLLWPGIVARLFSPAPVCPTFRAFPTWMALRPSQLRSVGADSALMIPAVAALRSRYPELSLPVVILAGTDDRHVDTGWHSVRLHRLIADSELTLVPGAGHMVQHTDLDEVMAAIDAAASAPGSAGETRPAATSPVREPATAAN
jgi:pimeloyl-ACP methyl ester carboxylesterase